MSKEEIKAQLDSVVEQLKGKLSTLPESISILVNLLIATFNMHFELTAKQFASMKASIDSLTQTIEHLTKTNQNVDLDALKRLLFQGGREQNEQPVPQEKAERLQSKKQNCKTR